MNVGGNFTQSGGLYNTGWPQGRGSVLQNRRQTYLKSGGTISNTINFTVNNRAILDVGTSLIDGSNGTFTLNAGAGIITAHEQGLSTFGATGSIQVTGQDHLMRGQIILITVSCPGYRECIDHCT